MKLRKQIRHLFSALQHEVFNALSHGHDHQPFTITGTGCMLCRLLERSDHPFAILQLAREEGLVPNWMPSEQELYNLIGEKAFKNKMLRDIEFIKNMPKKRCKNCDGRVTLFLSLKELAYLLAGKGQTEYGYPCSECGHKITIHKEDLPIDLIKAVRKRIVAIRKRRGKRIKNKFGASLEDILTSTGPSPEPMPLASIAAQNNHPMTHYVVVDENNNIIEEL